MTDITKDSYVYTPVDSEGSQIRLLTLPFDIKHHLQRSDRGPLKGTISRHYLPLSRLSRGERAIRSIKLPVYIALSYVWGDPARNKVICVDGKSLPITTHLYDALVDLMKDTNGENTKVWADAICINQDDSAERSAQIRLMREIYHLAADVRVFIGVSTSEMRRCHKFINDLGGGSTAIEVPDSLGPVASKTTDIYAKVGMKTLGAIVGSGYAFGQGLVAFGEWIEPISDDRAELLLYPNSNLSLHQETIDALAKWRPKEKDLKKVEYEGDFTEIASLIDKELIQSCEWYQRMWVTQELAVADTVHFQLGHYRLQWELFLRVTHYLHYVRNIPIPHIRKVTGLEKIRMGWNDQKRQPLRELVMETRSRQATDPRDKIYALIGLMGDHMNDFLKPDYSKPVNEVYANVTLHFITQSKSLDPICNQQVLGRREDLPSWVPDYSLKQDLAAAPLVPIDGRKGIYGASGYDEISRYSLAKFSQPWNQLRTKGSHIDTVAHVSDLTSEITPFDKIEKLWLATLLAANSLSNSLTLDVKTVLADISSVVSCYSRYWYSEDVECTNFNSNDLKPRIKDSYILDAYLQTLLSSRISFRERLTEEAINLILSLNLLKGNIGLAQKQLLAKLCKAFEAGMTKRRLIVTNGGYVGAAPEHALSGDLVCVMFGCSVPVILRKIADGEDHLHMLVGEAYVHGIMDAEARVMLLKGTREAQEFVLS